MTEVDGLYLDGRLEVIERHNFDIDASSTGLFVELITKVDRSDRILTSWLPLPLHLSKRLQGVLTIQPSRSGHLLVQNEYPKINKDLIGLFGSEIHLNLFGHAHWIHLRAC